MDEGYIKFNPQWTKTAPVSEEVLRGLIEARQQLYQANLIGAYSSGIGFGNISFRFPIPDNPDAFYISGSATGNIAQLTVDHFSLVTKVDVGKNTLYCEGPSIASSESMSHAVIYMECPEVEAVVHVHDMEMWRALLHKVPTTEAEATYGSPEMAWSIVDLLRHTDLKDGKLFVMEGHEEGVFTFGENLDEAVCLVLDAQKEFLAG